MITFIVEGQPIAQPRARITTRGKFAHAYTPKDHPIHAYRQAIQLQAKAAMAGRKPIEGPICIEVVFSFQRPKSHTKKQREQVAHCQKPDTTNLLKGLEDALNGICWIDDSQICQIDSVQKQWDDDGGWTRITIMEAT